ncbi:MAG: flagellar biosynthetic protein FliO [Thermoguttaceae bacterium]|nr:flagellar biosynthetic protein FliO [Thermoguttaceae bacterium]MDW8079295.1 flagellar biosynthetic protein FliO [Thermoguttaceae bacterium]
MYKEVLKLLTTLCFLWPTVLSASVGSAQDWEGRHSASQRGPTADAEAQSPLLAVNRGGFVDTSPVERFDLRFSLSTNFPPADRVFDDPSKSAQPMSEDGAAGSSQSSLPNLSSQSPRVPAMSAQQGQSEPIPATSQNSTMPAVYEESASSRPQLPGLKPTRESETIPIPGLADNEPTGSGELGNSASRPVRQTSSTEELPELPPPVEQAISSSGQARSEDDKAEQHDGNTPELARPVAEADSSPSINNVKERQNHPERSGLPLPPAQGRPNAPDRRTNSSGSPLSSKQPWSLSTPLVLLTVGVVVVCLTVIGWMGSMRASRPGGLLPSEVVEVLGRRPLTPRLSLQLIRCGNRLLLVAATPDGVNTLSEITEPCEVNQLLALCRRSAPGAITESFRQVFEQLSRSKELAG